MEGEQLAAYGIDYERGLHNCMDDLDFYRKILRMFLEDECFPLARKAFEAKDYHALFERLHELKGTSGNSALMELYHCVVPAVEMLRNGYGGANDAELARLFAACEASYGRTCEGIRRFTE